MTESDHFSLKYKLVRFSVVLLSFFFVKKINGRENLFRNESFIIASNHASNIDWLLLNANLTGTTKKHLHFLATKIYYNIPAFRFLVELSQGIWIEPKQPAQSLCIAIEYLRHGKIVGVFPEGVRSQDGKIGKGKRGVATLTLQAKVPVVPVGLINTHKILPRGTAFPRFARCEANIGEPMKFDGFYKDYDEAVTQNDQDKIMEIEEQVVRSIMKEIARLSNQEYPY